MLYFLYELFDINILQYISVRSATGFAISFAITLFFMPKFIKWAKKKSATQPIYILAPDGHKEKKNTPSMGGVVFLISTIVAVLLTANLENIYIITTLILTLCFMFIGMIDDLGKIFKKSNQDGLSSRGKFILQTIFGLLVSVILFHFGGVSSELYIPFYKYPLIDLGVWIIFFWTLVIVATSNAVNLTDGLDGLVTVPSIFSLITLSFLMYVTGHAILSSSLLMPKIIGVGEVVVFASSLVGGLVAFLWYNSHPAGFLWVIVAA